MPDHAEIIKLNCDLTIENLKHNMGVISPIYRQTLNKKIYEPFKPEIGIYGSIKKYEEIGYGKNKHYR